jgi:hypothetical protein
MSYDFPKSKFYQAVISGLFVGYFATAICLVFDVIYRSNTGFPLTSFINVSTIIFLVNILFPILGIVYYGFLSAFKKADIVFIIVFVLLTLFLAWRAEMVHRTDDPGLNGEFQKLLLGIVLILGVSASIFIPLLFNNKAFKEKVL